MMPTAMNGWLILCILCVCFATNRAQVNQVCKDRAPSCSIYAASCGQLAVIRSYCPATCRNFLIDGAGTTTCVLFQARCNEANIAAICMRTCCSRAPTGWTEWSDWGECSETCGDGKETRTRTCQGGNCPGRASRQRACNKGPCDGWSVWTPWAACTKTCGPGTQKRTRTCTGGSCPGSMEEEQACNLVDCPVWGDWSEWGPCSKTCGTGTRTKTRLCVAGQCVGPTSEQENCFIEECKFDDFGPWTQWGGCSATCGGGVSSRTRTCPGQCNGHSTETRLCNEQICPRRDCRDQFKRVCVSYAAAGFCEQYPNVKQACPVSCKDCGQTSPWGTFGPCSVTCGTGTKIRSNGNVQQEITCSETPCAGDPAKWGEWSFGECPVTCGGGTQEMTRTCSVPGKCVGSSTSSRPCGTAKCEAVWNDWGDWQECSKTCATGSQTRTRTCQSGDCGSETSETRECNKQECAAVWNDWQNWGQCTITCGAGKRTRKRTCRSGNCGQDTTQEEDCNQHVCPKWENWGQWEDCSETCGGGQRSRKRKCSVAGKCKGQSTQTETCNEEACPAWKDWSGWGDCTKTCGGGKRSQNRECTVAGKCKGETTRTENCNEQACELRGWGSWGKWSECSYACGNGERMRKRSCTDGTCEEGLSTESEACNTQPCENPAPGTWSQCTLTCGWGTQYQIYPNGTQVFQTCANHACPRRPCIVGATRYDTESSCCTESGHNPGEISCGQPVVGGRIIGGRAAIAGQWPWMVALYLKSRGSFCGGVLISPKWALSAGHCFISSTTGVWYDYSTWMAYTGINNVTLIFNQNVPGMQSSGIENVIKHPNHKYPKADIVLVNFKGSFSHTGSTQPLCLPGGERTPQDATCYVAGWGISDLNSPSITDPLQEVGIRNLDMNVCKNVYGSRERFKELFEKDTDKLICAGSLHRSVDSCRGDSGGPLMCQSCNSCTWYVAGVVSFGATECGKIGVPGVYTKITSYEAWILRHTGIPPRTVPQCPWRYGTGTGSS